MTSPSDNQLPLGVTIGDMAGVGPEIVLRSWNALSEIAPALIYADIRWLRFAATALAERGHIDPLLVERITEVPRQDVHRPRSADAISVVHTPGRAPIDHAEYPWGQAVPDFGLVQHRALTAAIADAKAERIAGIVTLPWHKARLLDVGLPATGHTEVLSEQCDHADVTMLLAGDTLRVGLVTAHVPLNRVTELVTAAAVVDTATNVAQGLKDLYGISSPSIAVCGLNPHAGERGTIGLEEETEIAPAIKALQDQGIDAVGPFPADTLFPMVVRGRIKADAIIAMYHDQGLGPLKTFHLGAAANITLGLPIIRTSVDHGTAYDIAGTGQAEISSFLYAYRLAASFAQRKAAHRAEQSTFEVE